MGDKQQFDMTMKHVLSISKAELKRRIEEDKQRLKIGKKRGPKPSASRDPAASDRS